MSRQLVENLLLMFNTKDRIQTSLSAASCDFQFPISNIEDRVGNASFHLLSAQIPNVFYPISAARQNNKLHFYEDGSTATTYTATLSDNNYTGSQLASALKTAMDAAGTNTYTVSYDSQSLKLTIATDGTSVKITTGSNSMEDEVGANVDQAFAASYVCAYPVYLSGTKYIDLHIGNLHNQNASSSSLSRRLYRIPMNVPFNAMCFHEAQQDESIRVDIRNLNTISVAFYDDKGLLIDLPMNHDIAFTVKLTFQYGHK